HKAFLNVDYVKGTSTDTVFIDRKAKLGMTKEQIVSLWGHPDIKRDRITNDIWFWSWCEGLPMIECYDFNFVVFKGDTTFAIKIKHQGSPIIENVKKPVMVTLKLTSNPTGLTGPVTNIPSYIDLSQIADT